MVTKIKDESTKEQTCNINTEVCQDDSEQQRPNC